MAGCNFEIPFTDSPERIVTKARFAVESQGGTFNGDTHAGSFNVSIFGNGISGSYSVSGQVLALVITDKPFLIPCSTIEAFLKDKLNR